MSLFAAPSVKIDEIAAASELANSAVTQNEVKTFSADVIDSISLCAVCYMKFNDSTKLAKVLHCGHTFCHQCLMRVNEYGNSLHFECPTCRAETKCQISKIPVNYHLMEVLRKMDALSKEEKVENISNVEIDREQNPLQQEENGDKQYFNEGYRQLIIRVKSAIMAKLDDCKDDGVLDDEELFNRAVSRLSDDIEYAIEEADMLPYSDDEEEEAETDESIEIARGNIREEEPINFESQDESTLSEASTSSSDSSDSSTSAESDD